MRMGAYNLAELADAALARHGDRDSLFFEGVWHRSGELAERSRRAAAGLIDAGVRAGDRVAVLMANCTEVGIAYTAAWRAGAVVTPVIFLVSGAELRHILADSGAVALVTTPEFLPSVLDAANAAPELRLVVVAGDAPDGGGSGPRVVTFADLESAQPIANVPREDDDLAALMYTGGTTGRAKGVMLSHRNLWFSAHSVVQLTHVPGVTRALVPLPLSHSYGLIVSVAGMHAPEPGVAVLMRWFDPEQWLRAVAEHRIHLSTLVPSMIQMLLAQPLERYDLSSLHHIASGAAPLAPDVRDEFERRVPGAEILEGYGLTESSAIATANPSGMRRVGAVGIAVPGMRVRIVDGGDRDVPTGEDGEILLSSPGVMAGYWKAPDVTAATLVDGWLHTGDIGHLDHDGYLTIVDRKKDLIIRGGFNVYPRDVEDVLLSHPAVAAAAVVGRPDARLGEEVVAFVELRPGVTATSEEVLEHARARLAANKYPREVHIVDRIPLTSVLKVDRKALRATLVSAG